MSDPEEKREYHLAGEEFERGRFLSKCGRGDQWLANLRHVQCQECLRVHRDDLLQEAAHVTALLEMPGDVPRHSAPRHPCGCRSVGECIHDIGPTQGEDMLALSRLVYAFTAALRDKLHRQVKKGNGGWDREEWSIAEIQNALITHIAKGDPVDVAAFAAFWWNRLPVASRKP